MASAKEMLDQALAIIRDLSPLQKAIGALVLVAVIGGLIMILSGGGGGSSYQVLYSSLSQEDAAEIVAKLQEMRIPYELDMNGSVIKVPSGSVLETRLSMAGSGLPRGGGVGFEIFDRTDFGATDFVQRLNYQRAMQGELARTIKQFQQVLEARVHIAAPKESVFIEDEKPPTASVSVKLRGNAKLSNNEIQAIVHLVGSAVPGLTEENITVVDTAGRLLFRKKGGEESMLSATQLEYQLKLEGRLRDKLETMFEEVVGVGRALARVSASLEFNEINTTEETFDPESQVVRSEQLLNEESRSGGADPQGIPGVKGSLATFAESEDGQQASGNADMRNNVTRNYEISKTVRHVKEAMGTVARLSVAVMVDGTYEKVVDKDGTASLKYIARSDEELQRLQRMAESAVGFDPERGDQIEVVSMPFASSMIIEPVPDALDKWQDIIERLATPIIYLLVAIGFIFFVVRPMFRLLSNKQLEEQRRAMQIQSQIEEPQDEDDLSLKPLGMTDRERINKLAQSDPDRAADLVRRWLREGAR